MSNPKFLRNRKTKVVFPFHPGLLRNKDMEPYGGDVVEETEITEISMPKEEPTQALEMPEVGSEAPMSIDISKAKKTELIDFAINNFGVQLEDDLTLNELRKQVKTLIEAN